MKQLSEWIMLLYYLVIIWVFILFGSLVVTLLGYMSPKVIEIINYLYYFGLVVFPTMVLIYSIIFFYCRRRWKMPDGNSVYNPFTQNVELHLGRSGNLKSVLKVINTAKTLNKNVYFVTNHIDRQVLRKLLEKLGFEVQVNKATWLQSALYVPKARFFKFIAKAKNKKHPCIACMIYTNK